MKNVLHIHGSISVPDVLCEVGFCLMARMLSVEHFHVALCDPALLVCIHAVVALALAHSINLAEVVTPSFLPTG